MCLLDLVGLWCCSCPLFPYLSLSGYSIIDSVVLKSPAIIVELSISIIHTQNPWAAGLLSKTTPLFSDSLFKHLCLSWIGERGESERKGD